MSNLGGTTAPPGRMPMDGPPTPTVKTRLCNKYNTAEGCKWGDKCHFAHGERELGKPMLMDIYMPHPVGPRPTGHFAPPPMANPGTASPASFGASTTAKISVDASLAGGIIRRGGVHTKQISRVSGAKLFIRDHESDTSLKNIELEGTFDQIRNASALVSELIVSISSNAPLQAKNPAGGTHRGGGRTGSNTSLKNIELEGTFDQIRNASALISELIVSISSNAPLQAKNPAGGTHRGGGRTGSNFKTKMCENFAKKSCSFGNKCHFAHGENELRKPAAA